MSYKTEEITESQKVLFLYKHSFEAIQLIKNKLEKNQFEIFSSTKIPNRVEYFHYIFVFDLTHNLDQILKTARGKVFLIIFNNRKEYHLMLSKVNQLPTPIKVVHVDKNNLDEDILERLIWFLLSRSKEVGLNLASNIEKKTSQASSLIKKAPLSKRRIILIAAMILFISQTFFLIPLFFNSWYIYKSIRSLEKLDLESSQKYLQTAAPFTHLTQQTYRIARPLWSFFYIAIISDNILSLEENTVSLIQKAISTYENSQKISTLLFTKHKSDSEIKDTRFRIETLKGQLNDINKTITIIDQKADYPIKTIQEVREKLNTASSSLLQLEDMLAGSDYLLGSDGERKFLLLFQNNMEIRPGGGFIGSYGIVTTKNFTIENIQVEDVYTADGQLDGHIDPPEPIAKYLNQPHWFLRDSNFSPDFPTNVAQAEFFLEKEMNLSNFDGAIAITTNAINSLIGAYGELYIPDYNDNINKDNFYIKTQTQVEKDFFPGSIQKKDYLSSITDALLLKIENDPNPQVIEAFKKSLDEKQIVLFFRNDDLQKSVDNAGWSGKILTPKCATENENCILDYFLAVDANLGVNKANFFVKRFFDLETHIDKNGQILRHNTLLYKNDSSFEVFPGGTYKNYAQLYMPTGVTIRSLTKNGTKIDTYDRRDVGYFSIIGFYFEVKPKSETTIEFDYSFDSSLLDSINTYQLVVQKQIGSTNNDIRLTLDFPDAFSIVHKNFSALEKGGKLIYNTSLTTDKIFIIGFNK